MPGEHQCLEDLQLHSPVLGSDLLVTPLNTITHREVSLSPFHRWGNRGAGRELPKVIPQPDAHLGKGKSHESVPKIEAFSVCLKHLQKSKCL